MNVTAKQPLISVIIPTFNRATLLESSLESLTAQSLPKDQYEVVVIDDGSADNTGELCESFASRMQLRYFRIKNSGISAAKNLGIFTSAGHLLLFFDDDDMADSRLLEEHVKTHRLHPQEDVAVLGYTTWAPQLTVTPVMDYVINIGQMLFAYKHLKDGQVLDFSNFWGGRSSCKRSLLVKHGVFNQRFRAIIEDIDLGYRLSKKFDFKVVFNRRAESYMTRAITFEEFCRRCERQGLSLLLFSQLHSDPAVRQYCQGQLPDPSGRQNIQIVNAEERWQEIKQGLEEKVRRVQEIERSLSSQSETEDRSLLMEELRSLYRWTFNAYKIKGFVEAMRSGLKTSTAAAAGAASKVN